MTVKEKIRKRKEVEWFEDTINNFARYKGYKYCLTLKKGYRFSGKSYWKYCKSLKDALNHLNDVEEHVRPDCKGSYGRLEAKND